MKFCFRSARMAFLLAAAGAFGTARAADLPEQLKKELDKAKSDYADAYKIADKKLAETVDAQIDLVRQKPGLKAEERAKLVASFATEKATLDKHGTIPFSPPMRTVSTNYLISLQKADKSMSAAYDKVIEHCVKAKNDDDAAAYIAEKKKFVSPKTVGIWDIVGPNFKGTWALYSDGSAAPFDSKWTFDKDNLVIENCNPALPKDSRKEVWTFDKEGQTFEALNLKNKVKYKGTRVDPK